MSGGLWYVVLARRVPVPAAWVGVGLVAFSWAVTALLGLDSTEARFEARVPYVLGAIIGYLVAATPYSIRKVQDDLDDLRPLWNADEDDFRTVREGLAGLAPRVAAATTVAALAVVLIVQESLFGRLNG